PTGAPPCERRTPNGERRTTRERHADDQDLRRGPRPRSGHRRRALAVPAGVHVRPLDWVVLVAYVGWIIIDGLRRSKGTDKVDGYLLATRSLPWWAVGLSVMATQMSAVTIVGTTGLAYSTGLRFIQNYFPLPLAMVILSLPVCRFSRARGFTPPTSTSSAASTSASALWRASCF